MNKKLIIAISFVSLLALPVAGLAVEFDQTTPPKLPNSVPMGQLWGTIIQLLKFIWPVFIGLAILMFLLAGVYFLTAQGDPGKLKEARSALIWGIVGVVVGILSFSLPYIVGTTLGL